VVAQCTFVRQSAFLWSAVRLTLYESGAVSGESKLVLSLDTVRPEVSAAAERPARRAECGVSKLVLSLHAVRPEVTAAAEGPA